MKMHSYIPQIARRFRSATLHTIVLIVLWLSTNAGFASAQQRWRFTEINSNYTGAISGGSVFDGFISWDGGAGLSLYGAGSDVHGDDYDLGWGIVGYASVSAPTICDMADKIESANIYFNYDFMDTWAGYYWSNYGSQAAAMEYVATYTAAHEMGHALGLDHQIGRLMQNGLNTNVGPYPEGGDFGALESLYYGWTLVQGQQSYGNCS